MKKIALWIILLLLVTMMFVNCGQSSSVGNASDGVYELYPTKNIWNFIKLNTQDGRMWQVQYTVSEEAARGETVLSDIKLAEGGKNGRFALYPTQNMWNFILLDRITGKTYQVQYSLDDPNMRGIVPITDYQNENKSK